MQAVFSSGCVVLIASFVGFGVLAHALNMPLDYAVFLSAFVWALPSQVVFITSIDNGASWAMAAFAVSLSAVRILPMMVTLMPNVRHEKVPRFWLYIACHFVAVTAWVEGMARTPKQPKATGLSFFLGLGIGFLVVSVLGCIAGFYAAPFLPDAAGAALLFLTPLFFALSILRSVFTWGEGAVLMSSFAIVPFFHELNAGTDLLWTALIVGTALFLVQRKWGRAHG